MKWWRFAVIAGILAAGLNSRAIHAQSDQAAAVAEVRTKAREIVEAASRL